MHKKTLFLIITLFLFSLLLVSCFEGYTASTEAEKLTQYLEPANLQALIESTDDSIGIIDVRPTEAYKAGHIPQAMSYPSSEILSRLDELSKDRYFILYCETGGRAQAVIRELEKEGYTLLMNWGGYTRWPYPLVSE